MKTGLLKEFGKAEGQGMKYIKSEYAFIKKKKSSIYFLNLL